MAMIKEFIRLQADVTLARQEFVLGLVARKWLARARLPDGGGRPVLLLPGFGGNEALLKRLNNFLCQNGYVSEIFVPGFPKDESMQEFIDSLSPTLSQKVGELQQRTGKAVSLVGQSAGGLYLREFTRRNPEGIDRVITLGSPTFYPENQHLQNKALAALIERRFGTSRERSFADDRYVHWDKDHPPIPYVVIYSPIDGAVKAETAVIPESQLNGTTNGALRENVAVTASHFGMVLNPFIILAVADRLGADPLNWKAFDPKAYLPERLRGLSPLAYPSTDKAERKVPSMDLHTHQPGGRDARERVIWTLKTEHGNIEKLLDTVLDELGGSGATDRPKYAVIAGILDYLHSYSDAFHHPREDLLFERLNKRQPELERAISTLLDEHQWFDTQGDTLEQALHRHMVGKRSQQRNKRLDTQIRRYVKKLRAHLRMEEKEVFSQTSALHQHDWMAIDKGLSYQPDPLFGRQVQQRYEELADALAGRVEGISESLAMRDVTGLETLANGIDALDTGLTRLGKQLVAQAKTGLETQRELLKQSRDSRSLKAVIQLPFRAARANGRLTKENFSANYGMSREIVTSVVSAFRQGSNNS